MWCSSATILILAVVIVSGDRYQGSCSFASPTLTSEHVAAQKFDRESHILVAVVVSVIVAAAAVIGAAVFTHARVVIIPPTCRVLDDSIRRVCWACLLPAND